MEKIAKNFILIVVTAGVAIFCGAQLPFLVKKIKQSYKQRNYPIHIAQLPYTITLYGTKTCPYCAQARKYLTEAGIKFNDRLIDESKEANNVYKTLEEKYVPLLISEKELIVGFDKEAYSNLVKSKKFND